MEMERLEEQWCEMRNANENENDREISIAYTLNKMIIQTFFNISSYQLQI